jgi:hypothetical protein
MTTELDIREVAWSRGSRSQLKPEPRAIGTPAPRQRVAKIASQIGCRSLAEIECAN